MIVKICSKCKNEKDIKQFAKNGKTVKGLVKVRAMCNYCRNNNSKSGYYYVYYLPFENYCGITDSIIKRISTHKRNNKNTEKWIILYCSKDKKDAAYHEVMFQSVLAMEGVPLTMFRN